MLPPREGFSPGAVGAIGLLVHRLCRAGLEGTVAGQVAEPFDDVRFVRVTPGWGLRQAARYAAGVPAARSFEVHNKPEVASALRRRFPASRIVLALHNDPRGMRGLSRALRRVDRVVAVSRWVADRVGAPALVIPNSFSPGCSTTLPRQLVILFAGRVVADKGADAFVDACAEVLPQLPGWRAEMIGADRFSPDSPETPFLAALRPRAAAAGVRMLGYQPHPAVIDAMARAAIVVAPSRWEEPFGLVALEAMAAGAALVCSRRGGLPEVAGDVAVYADPDAPGALAAAVLALARDAERRTAAGAAGRARATLFSTARAVDAWRTMRAGMA